MIKSEFTPIPDRDRRFNLLNQEDLEVFKTILPSLGQIVTDDLALAGYNTDWTKKYVGKSQLVLRPNSTKQVSKILKHCYQRKLAVVPQGGSTGLVGGSVPVHDEIIINMGLMR